MEPVISTAAAAIVAASPVAKDLFSRVFGASFSEAGEMLADPLRERRQRRAYALAERTAAILEDRRVDAGRVPDAVAVPLLQGATLNDDPTLSEMWAQLLATYSAGDTDSRALTSILAELSPVEGKLLERIGAKERPWEPVAEGVATIPYNLRPIPIDELLADHSLGSEERELIKENLIRLRVLAPGSVANDSAPPFSLESERRLVSADARNVTLAPLGTALLVAVAGGRTS